MAEDGKPVITVRTAVRAIRKIGVRSGDILLVQRDTDLAESANEIAVALAKAGHEQVVLVVAENVYAISKADMKAMNAAGWYHISQIRRRSKFPQSALSKMRARK